MLALPSLLLTVLLIVLLPLSLLTNQQHTLQATAPAPLNLLTSLQRIAPSTQPIHLHSSQLPTVQATPQVRLTVLLFLNLQAIAQGRAPLTVPLLLNQLTNQQHTVLSTVPAPLSRLMSQPAIAPLIALTNLLATLHLIVPMSMHMPIILLFLRIWKMAVLPLMPTWLKLRHYTLVGLLLATKQLLMACMSI